MLRYGNKNSLISRTVFHLINIIIFTQNGSGWKASQWVIWPNLPAQAGLSQSTLHRVASTQFLSISTEGNSTPSLGNLFLCSVTFADKANNISYYIFGNRIFPISCVRSEGGLIFLPKFKFSVLIKYGYHWRKISLDWNRSFCQATKQTQRWHRIYMTFVQFTANLCEVWEPEVEILYFNVALTNPTLPVRTEIIVL